MHIMLYCHPKTVSGHSEPYSPITVMGSTSVRVIPTDFNNNINYYMHVVVLVCVYICETGSI